MKIEESFLPMDALNLPTQLPGRTRALIAMLCLALSLAASVLSLIVGIFHAGEISRGADGVLTASEDSFSTITLLYVGANSLQVLLLIATAIAFLMWLYRAYRNLESLRVGKVEFTAGWAVGWFFIPFANLIMPYRAVKELWLKSDPDLRANNFFPTTSSAPVIGWWWGFWIVAGITGNLSGRIYAGADTASQLAAGTWVGVASNLLEIVAAVFAIMVVKGIDARQQSQIHQMKPPPPPRDYNSAPAV